MLTDHTGLLFLVLSNATFCATPTPQHRRDRRHKGVEREVWKVVLLDHWYVRAQLRAIATSLEPHPRGKGVKRQQRAVHLSRLRSHYGVEK